ncbi:MAG: VOC family protein [Burkholderiales bacterium]|nr:VOC family protein [Burkholderiales bacterium]
MPDHPPTFTGVTPYLHYDDLPTMVEWLTRVFGFVEKGRWQDEAGAATNAELLAGDNEIWLDGTPGWWAKKGRRPEEWIGIWVGDVDALFDRITRAGVEVKPPVHKFYGVRVLQVTDPEGYTWGFMQRAPVIARAPVDSAQ